MDTEERARWLSAFAESLPDHVATTFVAEAAQHPGEWPKIARSVYETYPAECAWAARLYVYDPGILYWQWKDGTGFPPPRKE